MVGVQKEDAFRSDITVEDPRLALLEGVVGLKDSHNLSWRVLQRILVLNLFKSFPPSPPVG